MDWESVDWAALERLRDVFLRREEAPGPYWQDAADLESYDFTFGRRIAWKWSAVLAELIAAGWTLPARTLVDWGCGTAIAARSMLAHFGAGTIEKVVLWDHSVAAADLAREAIRARGYEVVVTVADPATHLSGDAFVLVVSHVINELDTTGRRDLLELATRASAVIWVEPGTPADNQALIDARDELRKAFHCWFPCPHDGACGLRAAGNERHWCHHFARPPTEAFTEGGWAAFGHRIGIDLRSLPYSYLVLDRREPARLPNGRRIIGRPREAAGVMQVLRCQAGDVSQVQLQKRDSRSLWKTLEKGRHPGLLAWQEDNQGRIISG